MRKFFLHILLGLICLAGVAYSQAPPSQAPSGVPDDIAYRQLWFNFDGQWLPDLDASLIGPKNYRSLINLRYIDGSLEGVNGYSKINTTSLATYPKIRSGFGFKKDQPVESHILVQAYNSTLTASQVYENTASVPSAGDFSATPLHTDASGADLGKFSQGPRGTVVYCNGKESMIWGGSESQLGAFLTSTSAVTDFITNARDYTLKVTNTLQTQDEIALIGGGNDSYTKLLLHADGTSGSTTFTDSSSGAKTVTPGGDVQIDDSQAAFGSASALFDGSGDYLSLADSADFSGATGTLTLDLKVRFSAISGIHVLYLQKDATGGDHIILWQDHAEGKIHFQVTDSGASVITEEATWGPSIDQWYHLALIRGWGGDSDSWAITVDGAAIHTFTDDGTMPNHDQAVLIGGNLGNYAIDYSGNHPAITVGGGADRASGVSKFGSGSWHFDGTDDYFLIADHADFDAIGQTNATIDLWVRHVDHAGTEPYISHSTDANNYWYLGHIHGTGIVFQIQTAGGAAEVNINSGTTNEITDTSWHHIALCKVGNDYGIYKDGTQVAYVSYAGTDAFAGNLLIGGYSTDFLNGYMEDVRITHTNTFSAAPVAGLTDTITIPVIPVSADSDTKLLIRGDVTDFDGWMDEVRFKKGSAAWTADFAIPTRAYSDDALYWIVGATRPLQGIKAYIKNANGESGATVAGTHWNGYSWSSLTNFTDNTSGLEQTGTMTWTSTVSSAKPKFLNGYYLYWYQFALSSGSADIYYVTVDAPFQPIVDLWDGVYRQPIGFQASRSNVYEDYTLDVNQPSSTSIPIAATIGGLTSTDHIIVMFDDRATAIRWQMIAGSTNGAAALMSVYYWDGSTWVGVTNPVDLTLSSGATASLNQTGTISWTPPDIETEFPRELFGITGYAYKITFSGTLTDGTEHAGTSVDVLTGIPAQLKVNPFKFGAMYKNMTMLGGFSGSHEGNRMDFSLPNAPEVWNGELASNGGLQSLFFGGEEELTTAVQLYNRFGSNIFTTLVAFKNTESYLLTGESPEDFKIDVLSSNVGCPAPLTMATVELGYEVAEQAQRNVIMWLSNIGPMMLDGAVFIPIKGTSKFFDPANSECINYDYIANARGWYDQVYKEYNLLFPSGTGQQTCNKWIVYDLAEKKWFEKDPGTYSMPQAAWPVSDVYGAKYIYAGIDTGYMMRLENGTSWDGGNITQVVETGDFYPTGNIWDRTQVRRIKVTAKRLQEDKLLYISHFPDTEEFDGVDGGFADTDDAGFMDTDDAGWADSLVAQIALSLDGTTSRVTKKTEPLNLAGWAHRFYFELSTDETTKGLQPLGWGISFMVQRQDNE
jgi:hypothetical protein